MSSELQDGTRYWGTLISFNHLSWWGSPLSLAFIEFRTCFKHIFVTNIKSQLLNKLNYRQTTLQYGYVASLEDWFSKKSNPLLGIYNSFLLTSKSDVVYHGNRLMEKSSFQAHIVEQYKSYRMVVESSESVQMNLNASLFTQVIGLEWEEIRRIALSSDLWSPRSKVWPR